MYVVAERVRAGPQLTDHYSGSIIGAWHGG
jgi:hypothetical protein